MRYALENIIEPAADSSGFEGNLHCQKSCEKPIFLFIKECLGTSKFLAHSHQDIFLQQELHW